MQENRPGYRERNENNYKPIDMKQMLRKVEYTYYTLGSNKEEIRTHYYFLGFRIWTSKRVCYMPERNMEAEFPLGEC